MERTTTAVTPERYASGMTFDQYLQYVASPENLGREGGADGERRRDWSGWMRSWYDSSGCPAPRPRRSAGWRPSPTGRAGSW